VRIASAITLHALRGRGLRAMEGEKIMAGIYALTQDPIVRRRLIPLRPKLTRPDRAAMIVPPIGYFVNKQRHAFRIGAAFDILCRWELERRCPAAIVGRWLCEKEAQDAPHWLPTIARAREIHGEFIRAKRSGAELLRAAAEWSYRLSKLSLAGFAEVPAEKVPADCTTELLALYAVTDWESLCGEPIYVGYDFGDVGELAGGAEADLIVSTTLLDCKAISSFKNIARALDQLLCYYFLARECHRLDPAGFPGIDRAGCFLTRFATTIIWPTSIWTSHPDFAETEEFFWHAAERRREPIAAS
jgi:hypothetical protein